MKETARRMLHCLGTAVCGEPHGLPALTAEELTRLYLLASHHDMAHLVAETLGSKMSGEAGAAFEKSQLMAVFREAAQTEALAHIEATLEAAGVDHIPLKGSVIRSLYPAPWMRTGCDIDILIHPHALPKAIESLVSTGYRETARTAHDVNLTSPEDVHLELHYATLEEGEDPGRAESVLCHIWEHATLSAGKHGYALDDEMFYFYHIAHMAKHMAIGGCGVKPLLDLWLLCHKKEFDPGTRTALLEAGGLLTFARAMETLSDSWFPSPGETALDSDLARWIITGGVYGTAEHRAAAGRARTGGRWANLRARIWLPYSLLQKVYPGLAGRPLLTPLYQVRRWLRILFGGGLRQATEELQTSQNLSEAEVTEVARLMQQLGL